MPVDRVKQVAGRSSPSSAASDQSTKRTTAKSGARS
jgi:hypothetical protein